MSISRDKLVIVIARYNEDISNFEEFNDNLIVYNKGNDDINPIINHEFIKNVPNLGREAGTYCNYILDNYDDLPEYIIFTQGNPVDHIDFSNTEKTFDKFREIVNEDKSYKFKYISSHKEPFDFDSVAHIGIGVYATPIELGDSKDIIQLIGDIKYWISNNCPEEEENSIELINKLKSLILDDNKTTIWPWEFNKIFMKSGWYCTSDNAQKMRPLVTQYNFDYSKIKWLLDRPEGFSFGYGAIFIVHKNNILKYSKDYWQRLFDSLQELLPTSGWGCERLWGFLLGEGDFYPNKSL